MRKNKWHLLLCLSLLNAFFFFSSVADNSTFKVPSDAAALLAFKSKADLRNELPFFSVPNDTFHFCKWAGIQCVQSRVVRLVIQGLHLGGTFANNTLTRLDQLRVLSLQNNSLTGPIPDLSGLRNLKSLFLDRNYFSGSFPPSILFLHRLRTVDLSYNNLTGSLPASIANLDRLSYLRLEWNHFNGSVPPMNQSSLKFFNVSGNNFTGAVPVTPTLLRFDPSSFSWNPGLCGEIIREECSPSSPFFGPTSSVSAPPPVVVLGSNAVELAKLGEKKRRKTVEIVGFSCGVLVLICSLLCFAMAVKKQRNNNSTTSKEKGMAMMLSDDAEAAAVGMEQEKELEEKVRRAQQGMQVTKSGSLAFCAGEAQLYSLEQLMRASAELLGRGTIGTTYKAVLDNRLIVSVKRLDAGKLARTSREVFETHMESVGGLRHPNLVPLRAYFQANEERLLIYDYQPNGSLFSLIHGSKSTRAKPLHWTSCLKIAEDVAQGLSYIHQAWRLIHGNLKSNNVLLGPDFEACLADYCLSVLVNSPHGDNNNNADDDPNSTAYRAPETRNSHHEATSKSDVYAFGILLLELITGKAPSHLPSLAPNEMMEWVRSTRDGNVDDGGENNKMEMLLEVAIACSLTSPEQRPTMWQVMKMLQEIKDTVLMEDSESDPPTGMS
ncbi:probable inactive receptor kinase At5g67200 [Morus notabilis]|uniref:probable inactive receptor kinase At5g67200 n=1 Tax=Morus notabilis TaxID=981085 RepID=UPI000CECFE73|nr:probable inactive receptor kinase At5g67200 [Morus notabilis]